MKPGQRRSPSPFSLSKPHHRVNPKSDGSGGAVLSPGSGLPPTAHDLGGLSVEGSCAGWAGAHGEARLAPRKGGLSSLVGRHQQGPWALGTKDG